MFLMLKYLGKNLSLILLIKKSRDMYNSKTTINMNKTTASLKSSSSVVDNIKLLCAKIYYNIGYIASTKYQMFSEP